MLYEVSNLVSNHKYTEWEIAHKSPFGNIGRGKKKQKRTCFLIEDRPEELFKAYSLGLSIKPHAFKIDPSKESYQHFVNCVILDFDNLTHSQCQFIHATINSKYDFMSSGKKVYGDYSSGMKTWMKDNSGIPNAQPPKWKYKVFFPTLNNTLCVYEDVDRAFRDAVAFFNPASTIDEVNEVWAKWKKANNRKNMISDPIFNGWILPDVAMLTHFRSQITYSIDLYQKEKFVEKGDDWMYKHLTTGLSKHPITNKYSYEGLDWKIQEATIEIPKKDPTKEQILEIEKHIMNNLQFPMSQFNLPTTKSGFCVFVGKSHIDDLVLPVDDIKYINGSYWKHIKQRTISTDFNFDAYKRDANTAGKTFARIYAEIRLQGHSQSCKTQALEDCITSMRMFHGELFAILTKQQAKVIVHEIARSFMSAWLNYKQWRIRQKLVKTTVNPKVTALRNLWRDTKSDEYRDQYFVELNKDLKARWNEGNKLKFPFDYHQKGFKDTIMKILIPGGIKLNTSDEFIERLRTKDITSQDGHYSDETLIRWFYEYKTEWNKTYVGDHIGRKQHKSKYDELFQTMTKEQIAEYINKSCISPNMKSRLRKEYGVSMRRRH